MRDLSILPAAVLMLALTSARWAALARVRMAPGLAAIAWGGGSLIGLTVLGFDEPYWKHLLPAGAAFHGLVHGWFTRRLSTQEDAAFGSLAALMAVLIAGLLLGEVSSGYRLAFEAQAAWREWWEASLLAAQSAASLSWESGGLTPDQPIAGPAMPVLDLTLDQILGSLAAFYVVLATGLSGYFLAAPFPYRRLLVFRSGERHAPFLILALIAEAARTQLGLDRLSPYTVTLLSAMGALIWLQGFTLFLYLRAQGTRQARPDWRFAGTLGILAAVALPKYVAIAGLLDIYFDFRKLRNTLPGQRT